jgi:hypothetical protein
MGDRFGHGGEKWSIEPDVVAAVASDDGLDHAGLGRFGQEANVPSDEQDIRAAGMKREEATVGLIDASAS